MYCTLSIFSFYSIGQHTCAQTLSSGYIIEQSWIRS